MKTWQKVLLPTLIVSLIGGIYLFIVFQSRKAPGVATRQPDADKPLTTDELAYVKKYLFATFDQAKQIEGTNVWIKAGYSLPYFPYAGGTVQFAKRAGVLPAAEKLAVSKLIKAVPPAKMDDRVPHGSRQYFAVFTFAGPETASGGKQGSFAAPIGYAEGSDEAIWADQLFYYDDPRTIYAHWPKPVWDAIAAHTPTVGMSENQVRMAVGMMMESDSTEIGNRTVTYDAGGKKWTVTFAKDAATAVKAG
jgi:hypothetical protein